VGRAHLRCDLDLPAPIRKVPSIESRQSDPLPTLDQYHSSTVLRSTRSRLESFVRLRTANESVRLGEQSQRQVLPRQITSGAKVAVDVHIDCDASGLYANGALVRSVMPAMFRRGHRSRGQSLVEFALVVPILLLIVGAIIQFGVIFWAQNTLTQVVRDTGRWAATQQTKPCDSSANAGALVTKADAIAQTSSLIGYRAGLWSGSPVAFNTPAAPREGIEVTWPISTDAPGLLNTDCPPDTNTVAWFVNIRAHHVVPLFFPVIGAFIPSCTALDCSLSSSVQFRMEPAQ
jgi:TadE-like protein